MGKWVNSERTEEALSIGVGVVGTVRQFCMIMTDDAVKAQDRGDYVAVLDISQLLERLFL
jgi:hypothetical protein